MDLVVQLQMSQYMDFTFFCQCYRVMLQMFVSVSCFDYLWKIHWCCSACFFKIIPETILLPIQILLSPRAANELETSYSKPHIDEQIFVFACLCVRQKIDNLPCQNLTNVQEIHLYGFGTHKAAFEIYRFNIGMCRILFCRIPDSTG